MPVDVTRNLRIALSALNSERQRIDRQISAIRAVLGGADGGTPTGTGRGRRRRRRMSPAARRAVSARMKKYWAARRAAKSGGRGAKKSS
jgi:hypothetical protein